MTGDLAGDIRPLSSETSGEVPCWVLSSTLAQQAGWLGGVDGDYLPCPVPSPPAQGIPVSRGLLAHVHSFIHQTLAGCLPETGHRAGHPGAARAYARSICPAWVRWGELSWLPGPGRWRWKRPSLHGGSQGEQDTTVCGLEPHAADAILLGWIKLDPATSDWCPSKSREASCGGTGPASQHSGG